MGTVQYVVAVATGLPTPVTAVIVFLGLTVAYIAYYRFFHPLAKYPGPFVASFTNLWKVYQLWSLHMPDTLLKLHETYGDVVRVGPNDLSFSGGGAISPIYKSGRTFPKTKFYDGFTTFNPNLFGTQDEEIHGIRRRQMAHAFSLKSIKDMEEYIDEHLLRFRDNLNHHADKGDVFDLKELIAFFILDVLGDLAFQRSFDSQTEQDPSKLPPINNHIFLACLLGMMPDIIPFLKKVVEWTPLPWLQSLISARRRLKKLTEECVRFRLSEKNSSRNDLLTCLVNAVDPETGARLTELDINTEAFAMIVAGSHTTSGTLTLLFAHLLQNPTVLEKVVAEIDEKLVHVRTKIIPIEGLEQTLPYTMACVNENFRINPVFTMPLPRKVTAEEGAVIEGYQIPKNTTVFCLNHVVHHNPSIWGPDHEVFDPSRFLGPKTEYYKRILTPFSIGHRMCIGRNLAMTNLLKLLTTVLKNYKLELEEPLQEITTLSVGISEKEGSLKCRVTRRSA